MAAIIAVLEFPPRFSLSNHVSTESRYGIKSAFFDFLVLDACTKGLTLKLIIKNAHTQIM